MDKHYIQFPYLLMDVNAQLVEAVYHAILVCQLPSSIFYFIPFLGMTNKMAIHALLYINIINAAPISDTLL